jgi:hypothetical protein
MSNKPVTAQRLGTQTGSLIRFAEHVYPQADQINEVMDSFAIVTRPLGEELNRPKKTDSRVRLFRALAAVRAWFFAEGNGLTQALRQ